MMVGLAVNPGTDIEDLIKYAADVDTILVMTVVPGKGGQSFIHSMLSKVLRIRQLYPKIFIEVDGGVKPGTVEAAAKAGANMIVSGSGVFKAEDMEYAISYMRRAVEGFGNGLEGDALSPLRRASDADEGGAPPEKKPRIGSEYWLARLPAK